MVKQPTSEASEFQMSSEDFPALPGTHNQEVTSPGGSIASEKTILPSGGAGDMGQDLRSCTVTDSKQGIQTWPDGKIYIFIYNTLGQI